MAKAEPVRDHFINGVAGLMTPDEAAAWWAANPPPPPAEPATEPPEAPQDAGPSDSQE